MKNLENGFLVKLIFRRENMEIVLNDFGLEWKRKDGIVHKADYDDLINSYEKQMPKKVRERKLLFLINHYGTRIQQDIAIEELSELQKAIIKYRREPSDKTKEAVVEEIADVQVMLEQLKMIFYCRTKIDEIMDAKIDRQIKRIMDGS